MTTPNLSVRLITDRSEFERLGPEWDLLLERSASTSVFLTWGWLYSWWECFGGARALRICEVRDPEGRLVGIGPFCIQQGGHARRLRVLTHLGTERVSSDYLDVISEPGLERNVVMSVWRALGADADSWEIVRWPDMLRTAALLVHADCFGEDASVERDVQISQVCPYLSLAGGKDEQLRAFSPNLRMNVRRKRRVLEQAGAEIVIAASSTELLPALESLYVLHERRWMMEKRRGNFHDLRVRDFHAKLISRLGCMSGIRLHILRRRATTFAVLYTLDYKRTRFYYQSGYEPDGSALGLRPSEYSPGFTLLAHAILDAAGRGLVEFDFLRGPERYKSYWTRTHRLTHRITVVPRENRRAQGQLRLERSLALSRRLVNRLLGRQSPS